MFSAKAARKLRLKSNIAQCGSASSWTFVRFLCAKAIGATIASRLPLLKRSYNAVPCCNVALVLLEFAIQVRPRIHD
jgi:hypothetical protein